MKKDEKTSITLLLDRKVAEWIIKEAEEGGSTASDIVESLVYTMKCLKEHKAETISAVISMLSNQDGGDVPS